MVLDETQTGSTTNPKLIKYKVKHEKLIRTGAN